MYRAPDLRRAAGRAQSGGGPGEQLPVTLDAHVFVRGKCRRWNFPEFRHLRARLLVDKTVRLVKTPRHRRTYNGDEESHFGRANSIGFGMKLLGKTLARVMRVLILNSQREQRTEKL